MCGTRSTRRLFVFGWKRRRRRRRRRRDCHLFSRADLFFSATPRALARCAFQCATRDYVRARKKNDRPKSRFAWSLSVSTRWGRGGFPFPMPQERKSGDEHLEKRKRRAKHHLVPGSRRCPSPRPERLKRIPLAAAASDRESSSCCSSKLRHGNKTLFLLEKKNGKKERCKEKACRNLSASRRPLARYLAISRIKKDPISFLFCTRDFIMRRVSERARLSSCTLKEEEWWWVVEKRPRFFKVESEEEEEMAAGTKLFLSLSLSLSLSLFSSLSSSRALSLSAKGGDGNKGSSLLSRSLLNQASKVEEERPETLLLPPAPPTLSARLSCRCNARVEAAPRGKHRRLAIDAFGVVLLHHGLGRCRR